MTTVIMAAVNMPIVSVTTVYVTTVAMTTGRAESLYTRNIEVLQNVLLVHRLFWIDVFLNTDSEKPHMTVGKNASLMSYRRKTVCVT